MVGGYYWSFYMDISSRNINISSNILTRQEVLSGKSNRVEPLAGFSKIKPFLSWNNVIQLLFGFYNSTYNVL